MNNKRDHVDPFLKRLKQSIRKPLEKDSLSDSVAAIYETQRRFKFGDLSREDQKQLIRLAQDEQGHGEAADLLVKFMTQHAITCALRFEHRQFADLVQEGRMALLKGIEDYDEGQGVRISTFALFLMKRAMRRYLDDQADPIRLPVKKQEELRKIYAMSRRYENLYGRVLTVEELSEQSNISTKEIELVSSLDQARRATLSLESTLDSEDSEPLLESCVDEEAQPDATAEEDEVVGHLYSELQLLRPRERRVILLKYTTGPIGDTRTNAEIAQILRLSEDQVSWSLRSGLKKLRKLCERDPIFHELMSTSSD